MKYFQEIFEYDVRIILELIKNTRGQPTFGNLKTEAISRYQNQIFTVATTQINQQFVV